MIDTEHSERFMSMLYFNVGWDGIPVECCRLCVSQIWMLTGDKLETATCIAKSSKLVSRTQTIHTFRRITNRSDAHLELNAFRRKNDCALVITGESLQVSVWGCHCRNFCVHCVM